MLFSFLILALSLTLGFEESKKKKKKTVDDHGAWNKTWPTEQKSDKQEKYWKKWTYAYQGLT